jgi:hypothetical protein
MAGLSDLRHPMSLDHLVFCLALLAGGLTASRLPAQTEQQNQQPRFDQLRGELRQIRRDIAELRKAVEELSQVVRQQQSASEFSPVRIYVETADGRPLAGFDIELESDNNEGRRFRVTGTSNDQGLALTRQLPYGEYRLTLSEPTGWSARLQRVTVELGQPLELHVRAPDPEQQGTLVVRSALDPGGLAGLHFGERQEHERNARSYGIPFAPAPEPMEEPGELASFPTLEKGINAVALQLALSAEQKIEQPDGEVETWHWRLSDTPPQPLQQSGSASLLVRHDGAARIVDYNSGMARPQESAEFFVGDNDPEEDDKYVTVGYVELATKAAPEDLLEVGVPPGEVTIILEKLLGRAAEGTRASLDLMSDGNRQIWLEATLRPRSQWLPRLLVLSDWQQPEEERPVAQILARRTLTIESGKSTSLTLTSP